VSRTRLSLVVVGAVAAPLRSRRSGHGASAVAVVESPPRPPSFVHLPRFNRCDGDHRMRLRIPTDLSTTEKHPKLSRSLGLLSLLPQ